MTTKAWNAGLAAAAVCVCVTAGAQSALPDAQVESNVLRALASAPELSTQNIQSSTVYGVVTLTGNVQDEALRTRAENLAARANGVKKVVDQLSLGDQPATSTENRASALPANAPAASGDAATAGEVLQSDGSYAPATPGAQTVDNGQAGVAASAQADEGIGGTAGAPEYQGAPGAANQAQNGYPAQAQDGYPAQAQNGYPAQPGYSQGQGGNDPQQGAYPPARQPLYNQNGYGNQPGYGDQPGYRSQNGYGMPPNYVGNGQRAGRLVTVPAGAPLQIRINRGLRSDAVLPGTPFTAQVMADVVADGAVAIPRGATVTGVVLDAQKAGALKGRGALALQLTSLTVGGQQYALASSDWVRNGEDKTGHTVGSAIVGGVVGALFGAAIGGGEGAAIGAGVGGAAGVGTSAASPSGNVAVPPEALLNFKLVQPITVTTVGQRELQRLAYAAGPYPGRYPRRPYAAGPYGYPAY